MTNTKTKKHMFKLAHGVTVTVEYPYTPEDAIADFKKEVEALGGIVVQVHDELAVSNLSVSNMNKLMAELNKNLSASSYTVSTEPSEADYSALEERLMSQLMNPGPFGWPSFMYLPGIFGKSEVTQAQATSRSPVQAPKPKTMRLVKDVAPKAFSTWEFSQEFLKRVYGSKVRLVGQHFRSAHEQKVLGRKKVGHMALLVAEPDNAADLNAIMVLMWEDEAKIWQHVGYVRATEAALLRSKWKGDYKHPMVARITNYPSNADGHREGNNIELTLTGEVRTYPGYKL